MDKVCNWCLAAADVFLGHRDLRRGYEHGDGVYHHLHAHSTRETCWQVPLLTVHSSYSDTVHSPVPEAQIETEIQALYKKTIEDKKRTVFANFQINEELLDLALSKYSEKQQLSQAIIQMQIRQKQRVERARAEIF